MGADIFTKNLSGIQQDDLATDTGKIMIDFIPVEEGIIGEDIFEECRNRIFWELDNGIKNECHERRKSRI